MLQFHSTTRDYTCMLRESQTLTQIFLLNHNYSLVPPTYHHLNIAKLLQGIKLIIFKDISEVQRAFYKSTKDYLIPAWCIKEKGKINTKDNCRRKMGCLPGHPQA